MAFTTQSKNRHSGLHYAFIIIVCGLLLLVLADELAKDYWSRSLLADYFRPALGGILVVLLWMFLLLVVYYLKKSAELRKTLFLLFFPALLGGVVSAVAFFARKSSAETNQHTPQPEAKAVETPFPPTAPSEESTAAPSLFFSSAHPVVSGAPSFAAAFPWPKRKGGLEALSRKGGLSSKKDGSFGAGKPGRIIS